MKAKIVVSPQAQSASVHIDAWWRANRKDSRGLFARELRRALTLLAGLPQLGALYERGSPDVRRYFLRRTGHHIYYTWDETAHRLQIITVWNSRSEGAPEL